MKSQRSILVLTPRYPYPVVGGDRLRIYEICRELAKHYQLTLLSLCESREETASPLPTDGVFSHIERVYLPKWRSFLNVLGALPTATPLQVAYYRCGEFKERLQRLLPTHDYCLAHLIRTGDYVREANIPTILEMTDAISLNYARAKSLSKSRHLRASVYALEARRLLAYERAVVRDFELVTLVSAVDRDFLLEGRTSDNVLVCSNGVELRALPFRDRAASEPVLVFIGNMTSVQNLDACFYFVESVLPTLRQQLDCRLRVVGRITPSNAARLQRHDGVEVCANVDNVATAVGNARVGIAPIRVGAGVQNKILEYMALGLPVISSSIGLEGLSAQPGENILIADTPEEYVAHLQALWQQPKLVSKFGRTGLEYVSEHHAWSAKLAPMVAAIDALGQRAGIAE